MSVFQTAAQSLKTSNRRIVVMGAKGSGKTTFSISASTFAGDTISGGKRECADTLLIQGDSEGVLGAMDVGLNVPHVLDMTACEEWSQYQALLIKGLTELRPKLLDGTIKVIVIDLAYPARLIEQHVQPKDVAGWGAVKVEGSKLYRALAGIKGVTVVANCQIKSSAQIIPNETAKTSSEARSVGGELSTFTMALTNGIAELWRDNASFIFTREAKRGQADSKGNATPATYATLTQASKRWQAASRAKSVLDAKLDGDMSLRAILNRVYGESA